MYLPDYQISRLTDFHVLVIHLGYQIFTLKSTQVWTLNNFSLSFTVSISIIIILIINNGGIGGRNGSFLTWLGYLTERGIVPSISSVIYILLFHLFVGSIKSPSQTILCTFII